MTSSEPMIAASAVVAVAAAVVVVAAVAVVAVVVVAFDAIVEGVAADQFLTLSVSAVVVACCCVESVKGTVVTTGVDDGY